MILFDFIYIMFKSFTFSICQIDQYHCAKTLLMYGTVGLIFWLYKMGENSEIVLIEGERLFPFQL